MMCPTCGRGEPMCPTCGTAPAGPLGGACPACIDADSKRIDALAVAMGCTRAEVNPRTLAAAAGVLPSQWHEVTVDKILPKQTAVRAAVAMVKGKP